MMKRELIPRRPALAGVAALAATLATGLGLLPAAAHAAPLSTGPTATASPHRACADTPAGTAHCLAVGSDDAQSGKGVRAAAPSGYGPADIQAAYALPQGGDGTTVAIVDAYDDPNAESDLATYRKQYGL
ncbi:MAG TPA: peptidase S8, partial [Streptomyces sp.]